MRLYRASVKEKIAILEEVLGRPVSESVAIRMESQWAAFYEEPEKYKGTVVVDMVNLWIDEK